MPENVQKKIESIFFYSEKKIKEIAGIPNGKFIKVIFAKYCKKSKKVEVGRQNFSSLTRACLLPFMPSLLWARIILFFMPT